MDSLVTKDDLKIEIDRLEHRLDAMELRLTIKLGAFIAMAVGVLVAVLKAF